MKRSLATLLTLASAAIIWAQAPFTIVRPADGSKVREVVRVQIPKGSIPDNAYVGIYVGGKFVEATILDLRGNFYEYRLDTKVRQIPDGNVKLEVVLYSDFGDKPRIVDRSSVNVTVSNVASIPIPDEGLLLRYKFIPSTELSYSIEERTSISTISVNQARAGGRAALLPIDSDKFRMLYAFDNRYTNGDGLVRMQVLPTKGKDSAILRTVQDPEGRIFMDYEMHPLYMRISNTGREKFGSVPLYVALEGTAGEPARTDLFAVMPLPTLPEKRVRPGDRWEAGISLGKLSLDNLFEVNSLTQTQVARGELLGVEWESGHPCAKIKYSIAAGMGGRTGRQGIGDDRVQLEQTVWFAMDRGIPLKTVLDVTRDIRDENAVAPAAGGGMPAGGGRPPFGSGAGGAPTGPQGRRGPPPGAVGGADRIQGPMGGMQVGEGGASPTGGRFVGGGAAGGRAGGGTADAQLLRIRQQLIITLEK